MSINLNHNNTHLCLLEDKSNSFEIDHWANVRRGPHALDAQDAHKNSIGELQSAAGILRS